jgi:hypothetical protein
MKDNWSVLCDVYRFFFYKYDEHFKKHVAYFHGFQEGVSLSVNDGVIENSDMLGDFLASHWEWNK